MKRSIFFVALLSLFTISLSAQYARTFQRTTASKTLIRNAGSFSPSAQEPRPIKGQYIVQLKESYARPVAKTGEGDRIRNRLEKAKATEPARRRNLSLVQEVINGARIERGAVQFRYADAIVGFTAKLSDSQVRALRANKAVEGVFQDYLWQLPPVRKVPFKLIKRQTTTCAVQKAGGPVDGSNKPTWIWILDTGIDTDHPDLNVQTNSTFARSFISGQSIEDGNGHGTHVAGIAAAKDNYFGVVGVSAGARVVPIKVLNNSGFGSFSALIAALNHVSIYDIPGDVVNMSLGAYPVNNCAFSNLPLTISIQLLGMRGTWVAIAAGNDSGNANMALPGCVDGTRVFTVGALDCNLSCASYSNWGSVVDYAAVGTEVYSTDLNGSYSTKTGTSMATPVVAGIIHARGSAPLSAGNRNCSGTTVKIAKR